MALTERQRELARERKRRQRDKAGKLRRDVRPVGRPPKDDSVTEFASKQVEAPSAEYVAVFEADLPKLTKYARAKLYGENAEHEAGDLAAQVALRFMERGGTIRDVKNVRRWLRETLDHLLGDRGREATKQGRRVKGAENEQRDTLAEDFGIIARPGRDDGLHTPSDSLWSDDDQGEPVDDKPTGEEVGRAVNPYHQPQDDKSASMLGAPNVLCRDSATDRWLAAFAVGPVKRRGGLPVRVIRRPDIGRTHFTEAATFDDQSSRTNAALSDHCRRGTTSRHSLSPHVSTDGRTRTESRRGRTDRARTN